MIPAREEFLVELEARAKSVLLNPEEITKKCIEVATNETLEECKGRDVKLYAAMDFAMIRVKIYLKNALSEEDVILLKEALKSIQNSPSVDDKKELGVFGYGVV